MMLRNRPHRVRSTCRAVSQQRLSLSRRKMDGYEQAAALRGPQTRTEKRTPIFRVLLIVALHASVYTPTLTQAGTATDREDNSTDHDSSDQEYFTTWDPPVWLDPQTSVGRLRLASSGGDNHRSHGLTNAVVRPLPGRPSPIWASSPRENPPQNISRVRRTASGSDAAATAAASAHSRDRRRHSPKYTDWYSAPPMERTMQNSLFHSVGFLSGNTDDTRTGPYHGGESTTQRRAELYSGRGQPRSSKTSAGGAGTPYGWQTSQAEPTYSKDAVEKLMQYRAADNGVMQGRDQADVFPQVEARVSHPWQADPQQHRQPLHEAGAFSRISMQIPDDGSERLTTGNGEIAPQLSDLSSLTTLRNEWSQAAQETLSPVAGLKCPWGRGTGDAVQQPTGSLFQHAGAGLPSLHRNIEDIFQSHAALDGRAGRKCHHCRTDIPLSGGSSVSPIENVQHIGESELEELLPLSLIDEIQLNPPNWLTGVDSDTEWSSGSPTWTATHENDTLADKTLWGAPPETVTSFSITPHVYSPDASRNVLRQEAAAAPHRAGHQGIFAPELGPPSTRRRDQLHASTQTATAPFVGNTSPMSPHEQGESLSSTTSCSNKTPAWNSGSGRGDLITRRVSDIPHQGEGESSRTEPSATLWSGREFHWQWQPLIDLDRVLRDDSKAKTSYNPFDTNSSASGTDLYRDAPEAGTKTIGSAVPHGPQPRLQDPPKPPTLTSSDLFKRNADSRPVALDQKHSIAQRLHSQGAIPKKTSPTVKQLATTGTTVRASPSAKFRDTGLRERTRIRAETPSPKDRAMKNEVPRKAVPSGAKGILSPVFVATTCKKGEGRLRKHLHENSTGQPQEEKGRLAVGETHKTASRTRSPIDKRAAAVGGTDGHTEAALAAGKNAAVHNTGADRSADPLAGLGFVMGRLNMAAIGDRGERDSQRRQRARGERSHEEKESFASSRDGSDGPLGQRHSFTPKSRATSYRWTLGRLNMAATGDRGERDSQRRQRARGERSHEEKESFASSRDGSDGPLGERHSSTPKSRATSYRWTLSGHTNVEESCTSESRKTGKSRDDGDDSSLLECSPPEPRKPPRVALRCHKRRSHISEPRRQPRATNHFHSWARTHSAYQNQHMKLCVGNRNPAAKSSAASQSHTVPSAENVAAIPVRQRVCPWTQPYCNGK